MENLYTTRFGYYIIAQDIYEAVSKLQSIYPNPATLDLQSEDHTVLSKYPPTEQDKLYKVGSYNEKSLYIVAECASEALERFKTVSQAEVDCLTLVTGSKILF